MTHMRTGRRSTRALRAAAVALCLSSLAARGAALRAVDETSTRVRLDHQSDLIVSLACDDQASVDSGHRAAAVTIAVDGQPVEELLIFPGSGKRHYEAIVGPLAAGPHQISLKPARFWTDPPPPIHDLRVRVVKPDDPDALLVSHAPALWARADTVGRANDLPLVMYVEARPETTGATTLTYSMIFSNEDAGTATRALMARWGRTTDIEWAYEVRLDHASVAGETFQGPAHDSRPFDGARIGAHPILLVATMNNVFSDQGAGVALIRPVPRLVDLTRATRESVMDLEPWTYLVMAHELSAEHKVAPPADASALTTIDDLRHYVFVEAQLDLRAAAAIATARDANGMWRTSHGGLRELRVERNGWVRLAVPVGDSAPSAVGWSCEPSAQSSTGRDSPQCRIHATRAFRLGDRYEVGPNLIEPQSLTLAAGELQTLEVRGR
jgi:hypothetical protein